MSNLKFETLEILKENGKTIKDIRWVGSKDIAIPLDLFWILADTEYNNDFGSQKVARDLVVVGDNWWLERAEYDGSEWWEFKTTLIKPSTEKEVASVIGGMWNTLEEIDRLVRTEENATKDND